MAQEFREISPELERVAYKEAWSIESMEAHGAGGRGVTYIGSKISGALDGDERNGRLEVLPVRQLPWKYFARFEGSREEKKTLTEELFGKVRWLELAGLDEFAILTGPMTGEEFDRAAGQLGGLRRAIRAQV